MKGGNYTNGQLAADDREQSTAKVVLGATNKRL